MQKKVANGYTMVEMVVILAIVTSISSVVLFSFTGLNEGAAMNRSVRELALAIRQAQNMSLAVTRLEVGSPPTPQIPYGVGIRLSLADAERYFLFADLNPVDYRYTGAEEKIANTEQIFDRRVKISRLVDDNGDTYSAIHIVFLAPEAAVVVSNDAGAAISAETIDIELVSPSGNLTKTITVRSTGQISLR